MHPSDEMRREILNVVALVPYGKVATYGQIAKMAGYPRHARFVGRALAGLAEEHGIAWYRILNAQGKIRVMLSTDEGLSLQAQLLLAEGVFVENGGVCLAHYQWQGSI